MLVASFLPRSEANGPGARAVFWLQGCHRTCPGCCNPEMMPTVHETAMEVNPSVRIIAADIFALEVVERMLEADPDVRGLTLSGGEPLRSDHRPELLRFLVKLQFHLRLWPGFDRPFDVMAFTGYTADELSAERARDNVLDKILDRIDLLIAGPYDGTRGNDNGIVASLNQDIVRFSSAFDDVTDDQLINDPRINEIIIRGDRVVVTGLGSEEDARALLGLSPDFTCPSPDDGVPTSDGG